MHRVLCSMRLGSFAVAMLLAPAAGATGVLAGVGCDPSSGPFHGDDENGVAVSAQFCIDRQGDPWEKVLEIDVVDVLLPGDVVTVSETLTLVPIVGGPANPLWTDWHETVLDSSMWSWFEIRLAAFDEPVAGVLEIPGVGTFPGETSSDASEIWFEFPAVGVALLPLTFTIHKWLVYTGDPHSSGMLDVHISERPSVPEPATTALLAAGLAVLARGRRGRRPALECGASAALDCRRGGRGTE